MLYEIGSIVQVNSVNCVVVMKEQRGLFFPKNIYTVSPIGSEKQFRVAEDNIQCLVREAASSECNLPPAHTKFENVPSLCFSFIKTPSSK